MNLNLKQTKLSKNPGKNIISQIINRKNARKKIFKLTDKLSAKNLYIKEKRKYYIYDFTKNVKLYVSTFVSILCRKRGYAYADKTRMRIKNDGDPC